MLVLLLVLPLPSRAAKKPAETAYEAARRSYYALKADSARRKFRHHWQRVARTFEAVAAKYPQSERAPDALLTAGELFEELSRISVLDEDLQAAVADYRKLIEAHPKHRLADDAALKLSRIYADRLDQPDAARKVLARALAHNPRGDMARELKAFHASLAGVAAEPEAKPAPKRVVVELSAPPPPPAPEPSPPAQVAAAPAQASAPPPAPAPAPAPTPVKESTAKERLRAAARPLGGEITLAEQLGLKVRRVVIDAGHGGHDSGALGPGGTKEKDVALAIAKRVGDALARSGLEVMLTRDEDTFLRLEDRTRIANEAKGDLFISIHCNSGPSHRMRGIETYTLNTSADRYSIRLAARENSSSAKRISDLQFILADLATKANTEESSRLAERVQKSLVGQLSARFPSVKDLGTKQALFYVLLGAKMPAILVETSFLSNPEEEKRLSSKAYQDEVAQAIAAGVHEFLGNRTRLAKVN